jgi:p-aminobenzoyl-glutamate transporter AbgT
MDSRLRGNDVHEPTLHADKAKKKPAHGERVKSIPWRRIEETGVIMPHRIIFFHFILVMIEISSMNSAGVELSVD